MCSLGAASAFSLFLALKFTDLVMNTILYEWYIYVEDVFVQSIFRFTRDACFRVIRAQLFFAFFHFSFLHALSFNALWMRKLGNFSSRRFFCYCILVFLFCFFPSPLPLPRNHSLLVYLLHYCFPILCLSHVVYAVYNLTDCALCKSAIQIHIWRFLF